MEPRQHSAEERAAATVVASLGASLLMKRSPPPVHVAAPVHPLQDVHVPVVEDSAAKLTRPTKRSKTTATASSNSRRDSESDAPTTSSLSSSSSPTPSCASSLASSSSSDTTINTNPAAAAAPASSSSAAAELKPAPFFYYNDHSLQEDDDPFGPLTPPGRVPNFPVKMHAILSRPDLSDVVAWMPHSRAWRILKPREFEIRVIPTYFEHSKFSSFVRQANGWGFRRMTQGRDRNCYYHEMFLRGMPHLCKKMRRPGAHEKGAACPEHEPDLYEIHRMFPVKEKAAEQATLLPSTVAGGPRARMPVHFGMLPATTNTSGASSSSMPPTTIERPSILPSEQEHDDDRKMPAGQAPSEKPSVQKEPLANLLPPYHLAAAAASSVRTGQQQQQQKQVSSAQLAAQAAAAMSAMAPPPLLQFPPQGVGTLGPMPNGMGAYQTMLLQQAALAFSMQHRQQQQQQQSQVSSSSSSSSTLFPSSHAPPHQQGE